MEGIDIGNIDLHGLRERLRNMSDEDLRLFGRDVNCSVSDFPVMALGQALHHYLLPRSAFGVVPQASKNDADVALLKLSQPFTVFEQALA
jgi:hypothetical protein